MQIKNLFTPMTWITTLPFEAEISEIMDVDSWHNFSLFNVGDY